MPNNLDHLFSRCQCIFPYWYILAVPPIDSKSDRKAVGSDTYSLKKESLISILRYAKFFSHNLPMLLITRSCVWVLSFVSSKVSFARATKSKCGPLKREYEIYWKRLWTRTRLIYIFIHYKRRDSRFGGTEFVTKRSGELFADSFRDRRVNRLLDSSRRAGDTQVLLQNVAIDF